MGTEPWKERNEAVFDLQSSGIYLTLQEVQLFIKSLNEHGIGYFRLPTDAEWEFVRHREVLPNRSSNGLGFRIIKEMK